MHGKNIALSNLKFDFPKVWFLDLTPFSPVVFHSAYEPVHHGGWALMFEGIQPIQPPGISIAFPCFWAMPFQASHKEPTAFYISRFVFWRVLLFLCRIHCHHLAFSTTKIQYNDNISNGKGKPPSPCDCEAAVLKTIITGNLFFFKRDTYH